MRADVLNKNIPSINNLIAHRSIVVLYEFGGGSYLWYNQWQIYRKII